MLIYRHRGDTNDHVRKALMKNRAERRIFKKPPKMSKDSTNFVQKIGPYPVEREVNQQMLDTKNEQK